MSKIVTTSLFVLSLALAGCQNSGGRGDSTRHLKPLSSQAQQALEMKGMTKSSPILMKVFKQESELEVWKEGKNGRYELFKTYPICKWSGDLGPKVKEGDRQAPEGFYTVTPAQMNPNSSFYLSFNIGYPNKYDQSYGRNGSHLMVHGDCSSRGCYAMTDEAIAEVYTLARDAFEGGQKGFQLQAYPFRMTAKNFARHRNNPHLAFWKNLKVGHDNFEVTKLEPTVDVCNKTYVFNQVAQNSSPVQMQMKTDNNTSNNTSKNPWNSFKSASANPNAPLAAPVLFGDKCSTLVSNPQVAPLVAAKQADDNKEIASLIAYGLDAAPIKSGVDGGMHRVYAQAQNMPHLDRTANLPQVPLIKETASAENKPGFIGAIFGKAKEPEQVFAPQSPVLNAPLPLPRPGDKITQAGNGLKEMTRLNPQMRP
jgi:murein L,D-transpeptidase YafK